MNPYFLGKLYATSFNLTELPMNYHQLPDGTPIPPEGLKGWIRHDGTERTIIAVDDKGMLVKLNGQCLEPSAFTTTDPNSETDKNQPTCEQVEPIFKRQDEMPSLLLDLCRKRFDPDHYPDDFKETRQIAYAFDWDETNEGYDFWEQVNKWQKGESELPDEPRNWYQVNRWQPKLEELPDDLEFEDHYTRDIDMAKAVNALIRETKRIRRERGE
jgi:hypothetical protein